MSTSLDDLPVTKDKYLIRLCNGRKAMPEIVRSSPISNAHIQTHAIVIVVRPSVTVLRACCICFSVCESREAVASSRSMIFGCLRIALAIAI